MEGGGSGYAFSTPSTLPTPDLVNADTKAHTTGTGGRAVEFLLDFDGCEDPWHSIAFASLVSFHFHFAARPNGALLAQINNTGYLRRC